MQQDVFLSHASKDKSDYVEPLASALKQRDVTFWLDTAEIRWGDNITTKINDGLRSSRYAVVCLSANFLERPWPENEFSAALSLQNTDGTKRLLPLILNSKEQVLRHYPLVAGLAYREFRSGPAVLAEELAALVRPNEPHRTGLRVVVESVHSGLLSNLDLLPNQSVRWLAKKATASLGVREAADTGGVEPFYVRWVLVDVNAEKAWRAMPRSRKRGAFAVVADKKRTVVCTDDALFVLSASAMGRCFTSTPSRMRRASCLKQKRSSGQRGVNGGASVFYTPCSRWVFRPGGPAHTLLRTTAKRVYTPWAADASEQVCLPSHATHTPYSASGAVLPRGRFPSITGRILHVTEGV